MHHDLRSRLTRRARLGVAFTCCTAPLFAQSAPCGTSAQLVHTSCFPAACGTSTAPDWDPSSSTPLVVPKFDPALGELYEVELRLSARLAGALCFDNAGSGCAFLELDGASNFNVVPDPANAPQVSGLAPLQLPGGATLVPSGFALGPSDGFDDCAVPGVTQGPPSDGACVPGADHYVVTIDVTMQTLPVTLGAANLAPWIGASGSVAFDSTAIFLLVGNVDPEIQRAQDVGASVSLRVVYRYCPPPPGSVYCTCESLAPCGNVASAAGCANSTGLGARLAGLGSASVSAADLALHARGLPPGQPALFCQGDAALEPGVVFGDGLRCLASDCVRLEFAWANALGEVATSAPLAAAGGASPGEVRRYQVWYRDPAGSPCGAGFNLSNGYEVVWAP